jgi:hypothetical protein
VPLVACPFCREISAKGEAPGEPRTGSRGARRPEPYADPGADPGGDRETCAVCGVALVALRRLPRAARALEGALEEDELVAEPEWEPLPLHHARRGRGLLVALAVVGLAAFVAPWVHVTMPDVVTYGGVDIARRLGWAWAAAVAWFVLIPIVVSRRSIMQMRGARVAVSFLAAIPGTTAALLLLRPPHGGHGVPLHFEFAWGIYATLAVSVVGVAAGIAFGGRVDDIPVDRGTSSGHVVH